MSWLSFLPVMYLDQNRRLRPPLMKLVNWTQCPKGLLLQVMHFLLVILVSRSFCSLYILILRIERPFHSWHSKEVIENNSLAEATLVPFSMCPQIKNCSTPPHSGPNLGSCLFMVFPWKMTFNVPPNYKFTLPFLVFKIQKKDWKSG